MHCTGFWVALLLMGGLVKGFGGSGNGLDSSTVFLIRHAEKPMDGAGLAPEGVSRAKALVGYFKPLHLSALYAAADSENSRRPRLTLEPTAAALGLTLKTSFKEKQVDDLAAEIRAGTPGRNILICWHHGTIADLLAALGVDPWQVLPKGKWPKDCYDGIITLRFDAQGHLAEPGWKSQNLMPGDGR